jgi:hypothetical protein
MSFKSPRPSRARSQSSSPTKKPPTSSPHGSTPGHHLVLPSDVSKKRRGYGTKRQVLYRNNEVLAEPLGRVLVQQAPSQISTSAAIPLPELILDDPFVDTADAELPPLYVLGGEDHELRRQHQQRKRERQWAKWTNETIPSLFRPYLEVLRESDNLRHLNRRSDTSFPACSCQRQASINVTCVFFEHKSL